MLDPRQPKKVVDSAGNVGNNTHMKQNTYAKITGLDPAQLRKYKSEAALAGLSLSAYLLRLIEQARTTLPQRKPMSSI